MAFEPVALIDKPINKYSQDPLDKLHFKAVNKVVIHKMFRAIFWPWVIMAVVGSILTYVLSEEHKNSHVVIENEIRSKTVNQILPIAIEGNIYAQMNIIENDVENEYSSLFIKNIEDKANSGNQDAQAFMLITLPTLNDVPNIYETQEYINNVFKYANKGNYIAIERMLNLVYKAKQIPKHQSSKYILSMYRNWISNKS